VCPAERRTSQAAVGLGVSCVSEIIILRIMVQHPVMNLPRADGSTLPLVAYFDIVCRSAERCMCVNNRHARDALERAETKRHPPRTYVTSLRKSSQHDFRSEHFSKGTTAVDSAERYRERFFGLKQKQLLGEEHYLHNKKSRTISEWLDLCGVDLYEHGVRWPRDKLDELPDLRFQPKQTSGQCIAWQIFNDNRATHLPSFEELASGLDIESCRDAWFLEKPIKLKEDRFENFKAHLLEETVSKVRLLNVPVTRNMVSRKSQHQHSVMVRERVQHFYGVGDDRSIEIHDATTNVTPRGTATEIHHDSDPHISTVWSGSGASFQQPMKLWLLWHASESRRLATCYSDTTAALRHLGPCGYLIQYSGESLMLPANVPHAALSLSPHYLYGQTFHVEGRARDPTTLELELSALAKPMEAIGTVLTCYEEGFQDPDPRIRAIHINHAVCTISSEKTALHQIPRESYISRVIEVLKANRKFSGMCGICRHLGLEPESSIDCWSLHTFNNGLVNVCEKPRTSMRSWKEDQDIGNRPNLLSLFSRHQAQEAHRLVFIAGPYEIRHVNPDCIRISSIVLLLDSVTISVLLDFEFQTCATVVLCPEIHPFAAS
jgi:hypothetical protein